MNVTANHKLRSREYAASLTISAHSARFASQNVGSATPRMTTRALKCSGMAILQSVRAQERDTGVSPRLGPGDTRLAFCRRGCRGTCGGSGSERSHRNNAVAGRGGAADTWAALESFGQGRSGLYGIVE